MHWRSNFTNASASCWYNTNYVSRFDMHLICPHWNNLHLWWHTCFLYIGLHLILSHAIQTPLVVNDNDLVAISIGIGMIFLQMFWIFFFNWILGANIAWIVMSNTNLRLGFKSLLNYLGLIYCIQCCFFVYLDDHMNFSLCFAHILNRQLGPFTIGAPKKNV